jgi:hypothetical protein
MSKVYKIVTSQIETSNGNNREPNTFSYNTNGEIVYYDSNAIEHPVMDRGILFGANYDSSDQSNLNTIKLIPDPNSAFTVDQYLIVEPTGPDHIHIRSGGTIDESRATLILGGERNAVVVGDDERAVAISTRPTRIQNTYANSNELNNDEFIHASGADIQVGYSVSLFTGGSIYTVTAVTENSPDTGLMTVVAEGLTFVSGEAYLFSFEPPHNNTWTFDSNGVLYGPAMGGTRFVHIRNQGSGENLGIYSDDAALDLQATNELNITATDGDVFIAAQNGGKISLSGTDGAFIGNPAVPYNRITTRQEVPFINAAVPTSSIGQEGDVVGRGAMTSGYIYYCTGTYDGTTHIWKRVAWSNDTWGV